MSQSVPSMVEQHIRRWRHACQHERPVSSEPFAPPKAIAIAHEHGSYGLAVARAAGTILELPVLDREVLQYIACTAQVRVEMVESLDERARGQVNRRLASQWCDREFDQDQYWRHLSRAVLACWAHGPAVLVGRGCVHLVPPQHALRVRTVAPFEVRVRRVAEAEGLSDEQARSTVRASDRQRRLFRQRYFGAEEADPLLYDLVLNTAQLDVNTCARLVAEGYRHRLVAPGRSSDPPSP